MKRVGFTMKLFKGKEAEYKTRHDQIWPELMDLLKDAGIHDYVIYLDESTGILFASMCIEDHEKHEALSDHFIMKKWWDYMKDLMETNADHSPVSTPLKEMFYLP